MGRGVKLMPSGVSGLTGIKRVTFKTHVSCYTKDDIIQVQPGRRLFSPSFPLEIHIEMKEQPEPEGLAKIRDTLNAEYQHPHIGVQNEPADK